ncbi:uncharacterized protein LOC111079201 [Drosophila obscura]|uniref:uncharacterized protein LOC111079201 n=1 Tax=Drosophila obscura TaxID=7282 RepID=UPI001BB0E671|nr:uncharacterized protein LOC111079201 [Drosophila obscura]
MQRNSTASMHLQRLKPVGRCSHMATLQPMPLHHMDDEQLDLATPPLPINPPPKLLANGIIYGFRTRHLSCIEENDADSLAGSSIPHAYDMMQQADETFQKLNANAEQSCEEEDEEGQSGSEDGDGDADADDTIAMIDESRLCDADYLDELVADEQQQQQEESSDLVDSGNVEEDYWQHSFNRNDIMMTSVYGTLNGSMASENSSTAPPAYSEMGTPKKEREQPEPVYATPEKRRASNRSFDSTCASLTSSIYGGSMNSSLDLKYSSLVVSVGGGGGGGDSGGISATSTLRGTSVPPMDISMMSSDGVSALDWSSASVSYGLLDTDDANPEEELNEEASAKCLSAAESDVGYGKDFYT